MNTIGGYFGLEPTRDGGRVYHKEALPLNSGRNSFKHILQQRNITQIYIPYYTCPAILEPLNDLDIQFKFYHLDKNLEIEALSELNKDYYLLYINYFGLKSQYIEQLSNNRDNLIIDNSQAFYDHPQNNVDTFYSPRKFFGVPGGGYAYSKKLDISLEKDTAYDRCQHLLIRTDIDAETGYQAFKNNEQKFRDRPLKKMSSLTQNLLSNISYDKVQKKRIANYTFLHKNLKSINDFHYLADSNYECPLIYPFKHEQISRKKLINKNIYVPKYWPGIESYFPDKDCTEYDLTNNLIALPIDQRYNQTDMERIIQVITNYL